jgi:hypothetical protein
MEHLIGNSVTMTKDGNQAFKLFVSSEGGYRLVYRKQNSGGVSCEKEFFCKSHEDVIKMAGTSPLAFTLYKQAGFL